jgi:hypothetical protein
MTRADLSETTNTPQGGDMSEEDLARAGREESHDEGHDEKIAGLAAGVIRVMPMVTFGIRTAALAGLIVGVGAAAAGLGGIGVIEAIGSNTTCCP